MATPSLQFFRDAQGQPLKFFIAKDIDEKTQAALCEAVANHGGRIEVKVPRAGYILVEPHSLEEGRLRACWQAPDRPERYFVPHRWVEACESAGQLLKQIFVKDGQPLRVYVHPSIANVNVRNTLYTRIVYSGGDPYSSEANADVILADPNTQVWASIVRDYQATPEKYIESFLWVKRCIERGAATFTSYVYKNPGGRRAGDERMSFTNEDDDNLCQWIATKIPYKNSGGRTGNKVYQQLLEKCDEPGYEWVNRHTWQSWRERYKKNSDRLDRRITEIVDERNVVPGEKGQYGYVRASEPDTRAARPRKRRRPDSDVAEDGEFRHEFALLSKDEPSEEVALSPSPELDLASETLVDPQLMGLGVPGPAEAPALLPPDGPAMPFPVPHGVDFEHGESQFPIRIGHDPPPRWAQPAAVNGNAQAGPSGQPDDADPDAEVATIAASTRFTVEEVAEYAARCGGDLERTRLRFQRARAVLTDHFARED